MLGSGRGLITADGLRERLRAAGRRITPQRDLIFRLLAETQGDHPTAEALHVRARRVLPSLSLRTVYAVLDELREVQAVRPLDLGTGSARFCTNVQDHHHLVCDRCGRVKDVFLPLPPVEIPPGQGAGFVVREQTLVLRGMCADCQEKTA